MKTTVVEAKQTHPKSDYGYCETCREYFDLWKYGNIKSAGHNTPCKVREPTDEEHTKLVQDCLDDGCTEDDTW